MDAPPNAYHFEGNTVRVELDARQAQTGIDQFKQWAPLATEQYQVKLIRAANKQEQEQRQKLEQEIAARDERARVTKALKI